MTNKRVFWIGLIIVSTFLLVYSKQANSKKLPAKSMAQTTRGVTVAPDFQLKNVLTSAPIQLSSFKGSVVIVDFWATWCPPCRKEIPDFIALQTEYGAKGLQVIGISMDDEPGKVVDFIKANAINYPIGMGDAKLAELYGGIQGIPTTFILNRKLEIVEKFIGYRDRAAFEAVITPLLTSK